jgi:hypothetical protein
MPERSPRLSLLLIAATLACGVAVRFAHLGFPFLVTKYGGSMLWALAIYWVVSSVFARSSIVRAALVSGTVATAIEFFKLYNPPAVDALRQTLPGVLVLGRVFSVWDIVAYGLAIALGAALDRRLRMGQGLCT